MLIGYGSECGTAFKLCPNSEESAIVVGFYKLAVRISIGSGFMGTVFGWIAMLGAMGGGSAECESNFFIPAGYIVSR